MPPGAETAIKAAAETGDWMMVLFVIVMLLCFGALAWLVRTRDCQACGREERMAKRIDTLEDFQRDEMTKLIMANTSALNALQNSLGLRPCLLPSKVVAAAIEAMHKDAANRNSEVSLTERTKA